jgi:hypothetical protein
MVYIMIVLPSIDATWENMYIRSLKQSLLAIYWSVRAISSDQVKSAPEIKRKAPENEEWHWTNF